MFFAFRLGVIDSKTAKSMQSSRKGLKTAKNAGFEVNQGTCFPLRK